MSKLLIAEIKKQKVEIISWTAGIVVFVAVLFVMFPEIAKSMDDIMATGVLDTEFAIAFGMGDLSSLEAFVGGLLFPYIAMGLGVYGVLYGVKTLIGEEYDGRLEIIMAQPISRIKVVVTKILAIGVVMGIILLIVGLVVEGMTSMIDPELMATELVFGDMLVATLAAWPIIMVMTLFGFMLGTIVATDAQAKIGAMIFYLYNVMGTLMLGMVLRPDHKAHDFIPFNYYDVGIETFRNGYDMSNIALLLGMVAIFTVVSVIFFNRRDLFAFILNLGPKQKS